MTQERIAKNFDETVADILRIYGDLGFSIVEQARICGYMQPVGDDPEYLKRVLRHLDRPLMLARFERLYRIKGELNALFDGDIDKIKRWIGVHQPEFMGDSVRSLLASGDSRDMERVFEILSRAKLA